MIETHPHLASEFNFSEYPGARFSGILQEICILVTHAIYLMSVNLGSIKNHKSSRSARDRLFSLFHWVYWSGEIYSEPLITTNTIKRGSMPLWFIWLLLITYWISTSFSNFNAVSLIRFLAWEFKTWHYLRFSWNEVRELLIAVSYGARAGVRAGVSRFELFVPHIWSRVNTRVCVEVLESAF